MNIKWADNPSRIISLFFKYDEVRKTLSITTPTDVYTTKIYKNEDVEKLKITVANALSGQPIKNTLKILESL